jgi:hypothetical protein
MNTNVLVKLASSLLRLEEENGDNRFLRNVGTHYKNIRLRISEHRNPDTHRRENIKRNLLRISTVCSIMLVTL